MVTNYWLISRPIHGQQLVIMTLVYCLREQFHRDHPLNLPSEDTSSIPTSTVHNLTMLAVLRDGALESVRGACGPGLRNPGLTSGIGNRQS